MGEELSISHIIIGITLVLIPWVILRVFFKQKFNGIFYNNDQNMGLKYFTSERDSLNTFLNEINNLITDVRQLSCNPDLIDKRLSKVDGYSHFKKKTYQDKYCEISQVDRQNLASYASLYSSIPSMYINAYTKCEGDTPYVPQRVSQPAYTTKQIQYSTNPVADQYPSQYTSFGSEDHRTMCQEIFQGLDYNSEGSIPKDRITYLLMSYIGFAKALKMARNPDGNVQTLDYEFLQKLDNISKSKQKITEDDIHATYNNMLSSGNPERELYSNVNKIREFVREQNSIVVNYLSKMGDFGVEILKCIESRIIRLMKAWEIIVKDEDLWQVPGKKLKKKYATAIVYGCPSNRLTNLQDDLLDVVVKYVDKETHDLLLRLFSFDIYMLDIADNNKDIVQNKFSAYIQPKQEKLNEDLNKEQTKATKILQSVTNNMLPFYDPPIQF